MSVLYREDMLICKFQKNNLNDFMITHWHMFKFDIDPYSEYEQIILKYM